MTEHDDELLELAHPYALDALDAPARAEVEARLARADPASRAEFESIVTDVRETLAHLSAASAAEPPPQLRADVLASIADVPRTHAPPLRRRRPYLLVAAAAAAVALIFGAVAVIVELADRPVVEQQLTIAQAVEQAPDRKIATAAIEGGGSLAVTYSRERDAALVRFDGVAAPAPDRIYQLWVIAGAPRSAGLVPAFALGDTVVVTAIRDAAAVAVTVEPAAGSTAPTSDPLAVAKF